MSAVPLPILALVCLAVVAAVLWKPHLAVVLFCLATPFALVTLPAGLDLVTLMSGLVVGVGLLDHLLRSSHLLPQSPMAVGALIWTLGVVGSVAFSSDVGRAATLGAWQILAAWLAVAIAQLVTSTRHLYVVTIAVLLGTAVISASGLSGGFNQAGAFDASVVQNRAMGVFSQPNEYGLYTSMMWAFCLGLACLTQGWIRILASACSVLSLAGLAASFSRGSWLGALVAAIAMAILVPQTRKPQAVAVISIVTVLSASLVVVPYWQLPGLLLGRFASIFGGESNPYDNRPALMAEGLRQWGDQPVFGVGPNMYPVEAVTLDSGTRTIQGEHAHNLVITMGAEQGIIGLVAVAFFAAAIIHASRTARRYAVTRVRPRPTHIPLGAAVTLAVMGALIALIAAGMVDYPLRNPLTRGTCWMLIGLLLAGQRCLDREAPASEQAATEPHAITA